MDVVHFSRAGSRAQLPQSFAAEQRQRRRHGDRGWRRLSPERLSVSECSEDPHPHALLSWSSVSASKSASQG